MVHIIIILHFLSFAFGVGVITLSWLEYKKEKKSILKDVVIGEIIFSSLLFTDTLRIYTKKILEEYKTDTIISIISFVLAVSFIFYAYKIIKKAKDNELINKLSVYIKIIMGLIIITTILYVLSYNIKLFQKVPYLGVIYLLQCILVILCIREQKEFGQEEKEEIIQEEKEEVILEKKDLECLTNRENEILNCIMMGLSNKEIGEKLFISANTVKNHVYNIYKKLNVKNKVELMNLVNKRD